MRAYFEKALNLKIDHDEEMETFSVSTSQQKIYVKYETVEENTWKITKVHIPQELRGMNIANRIVEYILEHARKQNIYILPACAFIKSYIIKNPYYQSLVVK